MLPPPKFEGEHVEGAINIPLRDLNEQTTGGLDKDRPVIVYWHDALWDMSPRAAARLETLGFTKVYDYVASKADWLATVLPSAGSSAWLPDARSAVRGDDTVCHLGDRLGDSADRVRAAGKDVCIVVDGHHVVLGRVRGRAFDGDPDALIEDVMQPGPSTIRPDTPLETVVKSLREGGVISTLVTDPRGRLIGTVYLEDAERILAEETSDS